MLRAILVAGWIASLGCAEPQEPNVLVIVVDTLRVDRVGLYGHDVATTPAIDALGARSLVVENAYSQSSWTKPSVGSLMTSVHERLHGARRSSSDRLAESLDTLPELLAAAGYQTAAVSENPHVHPTFGFGQGFEHFETSQGYVGDPIWAVESAIEWLDSRWTHEPFFLYLQILDPHGPYTPTRENHQRFTAGLAAERPDVATGRIAELLDGEKSVVLTPGDVRYLSALYDAEILETDSAVGRLLGWLEDEGVARKTIVLLTSDHGEEFFEHGSIKHGYWLFEETIRIPMILHVPGREPRRHTGSRVQLIDVAPTILELVGQEVPEHFEGRSIVPLLSGVDLPPRPLLFETHFRGTSKRAVLVENHKLVVDDTTGTRQLYDLTADPGETQDIASVRPEVVQQLEAVLDAGSQATAGAGDPIEGELDPAIRDALERLGYVAD
jgi:arylsulfatase A-like enzyme